MAGELDSINAVVAAPFPFDHQDHQVILRTRDEVEKKHHAVVAKKGKRKVPAFTVGIFKDAPQLNRKTFPACEVFRIQLTEAGEHVDVYVNKGKVIGFSD